MGKIIISASILQEDYDSFHSMLNEELPPTHSEWLANKTMEDGKHTANGAIINKVVIHPQEYADYCRDSGLDTNLVTLETQRGNSQGKVICNSCKIVFCLGYRRIQNDTIASLYVNRLD